MVTNGVVRGLAERRLAVQYAVSLVLAESPDLGDAAPRLLRAMGEGLDWQIGAFWRVDRLAAVLRCEATWQAPGLMVTEFERATRETTFTAGVGLPGRAWAGGEPVWVIDVLGDDNFPRLGAATAEGLHGAIAFPVRGPSGVLGVVEFYDSALQTPDVELIHALAALGNQIGQFIERKQAEDAVRASEARTRAILEAVLDAIVTIDHEGRVVDFNPAAETIFGYSRAAAIGQPISDLIIPPSLRAAHLKGLARYLASGAGRMIGQRVETTAMRADGSEFPVELAITRIQVEGPPMFTGHIRDISARKATEEALRASEQRWRLVIANAPIILFAFDRDGVFTLAEGRGLEALGLTPDAVVGRSAFEMFRNVPRSLDHLRRALAGESFSSIDEINGPIFETWWMPLRDQYGGVSGATGVAADVTERTRAMRVRDEVMTMTSHDLRTPLTNILGRADLVEMRLNKGAPMDDAWLRMQLEALRGSARRMLSTVEEIADTARLHIGQTLELRKGVVDVGELVYAVAAEAGAGRDAASVIVEAPAGVMVEGDRVRLERVMQNLIDNAVKYSPKEIPVRVGVCTRDEWAAITVRDEGVGIPAEDLPHIFTPFYRASTASGIPGTGIGLSGVRAIVEQHGGQITVESAVGRGTTVTVRLPRAPMALHSGEDSSPAGV